MVNLLQRVKPLLILILILCVVDTSHAEFSLPQSMQVHGFASTAYINTTENNFFGDTADGGDVDFWELGVSGSWRVVPNLQLSLQVVSRQAGELDDGEPRIDYGLMDYTFLSDTDNLWGVRLGRVVNPFGFYNETRDMPFTRPSILLPQSIYFDRNRQLSLSGDGGQLYAERRTDLGDFLLQFNLIRPRVDDPGFKEAIAGQAPGDLEGALSFGGRLTYEKDGGKIRLAISGGQLNVDFDPSGEGPNLDAGTFTFEPIFFSAQYNAERWSLTGEYALRRTDFGRLRAIPFPSPDFTGESFYVQGTYRFHPRWGATVRFDQLIWDTDDRGGKTFEAFTGLPAHSRFAKDWTFGLRWDVTSSFMLRAEYHDIDGTGWLSGLENPDGTEQHWSLFAILAAFRF